MAYKKNKPPYGLHAYGSTGQVPPALLPISVLLMYAWRQQVIPQGLLDSSYPRGRPSQSFRLLALACLSPGGYRHLGDKPAEGLSLPFKYMEVNILK